MSSIATGMRGPKTSLTRVILRRVHIALAIPIMGYIYSPFAVLPSYAPPTRLIFFPAMVLTGLWMWKGHILRKFFARRQAAGVEPA